jgi:hypothetical protein
MQTKIYTETAAPEVVEMLRALARKKNIRSSVPTVAEQVGFVCIEPGGCLGWMRGGDDGEHSINWFAKNGYKPVMLDKFIENILSYNSSIKIEISSQYTAEISKDSIKVGCQTISFEKFDEIAAAVEKMRK